jgi:hypothetical protein
MSGLSSLTRIGIVSVTTIFFFYPEEGFFYGATFINISRTDLRSATWDFHHFLALYLLIPPIN